MESADDCLPEKSSRPDVIRSPVTTRKDPLYKSGKLAIDLRFGKGMSRKNIIERGHVNRGRSDRAFLAFKSNREIGEVGKPRHFLHVYEGELFAWIDSEYRRGHNCSFEEIRTEV